MKFLSLAPLFLITHCLAENETGDAERITPNTPATAQNELPPGILKVIPETRRLPLIDLDRDGWDDHWSRVYKNSQDGKSFAGHLRFNPEGDADGDGTTNYVEMLDFRNPYGSDTPPPPLTKEELKASRIAALKANKEIDARKMSRFQALLEERGILQRGEGDEQKADPGNPAGESSFHNPGDADGEGGLMLCSTAGGTTVIFQERLSSGQCLIAWEGAGDKLFDVEWSDDLVTWHLGNRQIPAVGGVGTWGQLSLSPHRFYRVDESEASSTIPSDPSGGDGITTFGATLAPLGDTGSYQVTVNLPAGKSAGRVDLMVDGELHSHCAPTGIDNVFVGPIHRWSLLEGSHTVQAVIWANEETTALLDQQKGGVLMTRGINLSLGANDEAVGFRVTEERIAPEDPDVPDHTEVLLNVPYEVQGDAIVRIDNEEGDLVRQWIIEEDDFPVDFREVWDGTDQDGSQVSTGLYSISLSLPGGFGGESILVAVGAPPWKALCLSEGLIAQPKTPEGQPPTQQALAWATNFRPSWAANFLTSGNGWTLAGEPANDSIISAWGPWGTLGSITNISDEIKGRKKLVGLEDTGKWKISQWQAGSKYNDSIADPVAAFVAGLNPFNTYDIGVFQGHGVACAGVPKAGTTGVTPRQPQHYFPLVTNPATGAAHWVGSAEIPKYGATGKLKWMFLLTCNPLLSNTGHAIYDDCKANGKLPFGPGLHVLCGYNSKIKLKAGMGTLLTDALVNKIAGQPYRDGTVVNAWGYVWNKSSNRTEEKVARATYWADCKDDTIYGVKHENIGNPPASAPQSALKERDFSVTTP